MKYKTMTKLWCLVVRLQIDRPRSNHSSLCGRSVVNRVAIEHDFLCTLHFLCWRLFHQGSILVQCGNFGLQNESIQSHPTTTTTLNPHLMFSFNGPQVNTLSAEWPLFQFHLSLDFSSTYTLPKMQNRNLSTINKARTAQTVQWLQYGPHNLGFNFWQRRDTPILQYTDNGSGTCPAYSTGQGFFPCRL